MGIFQLFPKGGIHQSRLYGTGLYPGAGVLANFIMDGRTQNDADAAAVISACSLSAGAQQNAAYFLVGALKFYSLWSKMTGLYGLAGGTAAAHKINWKTPGTYDIQNAANATWTSGVTHNSNGITGNGSTGYGDTGIAPNLMGQNSLHFSVYNRSTAASNGCEIGVNDSTRWSHLFCNYSAGQKYFVANYSYNGIPVIDKNTGMFIVGRNVSTYCRMYIAGQKRSDYVVPSNAPATLPFYLLCRNIDGVASGFSNKNLAFASIGSGLTDQDAYTLSWIVQAYQRILGRDV